MDWVNVRIKGTGQVTEMAPYVAEQLIASGRAEKVTKGEPAKPQEAIIQTAAISTPKETATANAGGVAFHLGPRSPRPQPRG